MNSLMVIYPRKDRGVWVFDDEATGLVREPFVCGIPEIINYYTRDLDDADKGFSLVFSSSPFPNYHTKLRRICEDSGGNWYEDSRTSARGWLCPALFKYFEEAPDNLYASFIGSNGHESNG